jgi:hypothetical protein
VLSRVGGKIVRKKQKVHERTKRMAKKTEQRTEQNRYKQREKKKKEMHTEHSSDEMVNAKRCQDSTSSS